MASLSRRSFLAAAATLSAAPAFAQSSANAYAFSFARPDGAPLALSAYRGSACPLADSYNLTPLVFLMVLANLSVLLMSSSGIFQTASTSSCSSCFILSP